MLDTACLQDIWLIVAKLQSFLILKAILLMDSNEGRKFLQCILIDYRKNDTRTLNKNMENELHIHPLHYNLSLKNEHNHIHWKFSPRTIWSMAKNLQSLISECDPSWFPTLIPEEYP